MSFGDIEAGWLGRCSSRWSRRAIPRARADRGETGARRVKGAEIALAKNGGGVIGMEEAVASVVILLED